MFCCSAPTQDHLAAALHYEEAYAALSCQALEASVTSPSEPPSGHLGAPLTDQYYLSDLCCMLCLNVLMELSAAAHAKSSGASAAGRKTGGAGGSRSVGLGKGKVAQAAKAAGGPVGGAVVLAGLTPAQWLDRAKSHFAVFFAPADDLFHCHFASELGAIRAAGLL